MYKSECGPVSRTGQSYPANKHTPSKKMNSFYRFALPEGSIDSYRQSELFNQLSQSAQCNVVRYQKQNCFQPNSLYFQKLQISPAFKLMSYNADQF